MTIANFDKRVLIEQVRLIEAQPGLLEDATAAVTDFPPHSDFEARLWLRASRLIERQHVQLGRAARLSALATTLALILAALLGALATVYAVTASSTINIYWLLMVLLGFNLLSMLLWLVGVSLQLDGLMAGVLAKLSSWLPSLKLNQDNTSSQADQAWVACQFGGRVGKWALSARTHQLWLAYLLAGLVVLLLVLMARQVDFVWGTTLLSDAAFMRLTEVLSQPLQALGFSTPTAQQVQNTRIGALQTLAAEHRYAWAQFLLGSLLCFGILPRILLWGWSLLMCAAARREFSLDYYLPYYIRLRQQLMPLAGHGQIVDADTAPPAATAVIADHPLAHELPVQTRWVAVELGDNIRWPLASINPGDNLGQVIDRESMTNILQALQIKPAAELAIAVAAARPPDRGLQRSISRLLEHSAQRWLVLVQEPGQQAIPEARLTAWYRLAQACQIPADHVISVSVV